MNNPFSFLRNKLIQKPATIDGNLVNKVITSPTQFTEKERQLLRQIGASVSTISNIFSDVLSINLERAGIYREVERSCDHPYMTGALELYADCATTYNYLHNATVWVTSDNQKYSNDLNEMLNNICIEEKIFDWAWTIAAFGDLFPRVIAKPGLGIITVDDDEHPLNISRVDYNGILVGFIQTPQGQPSSSSNSITLMPPWEYCHFRLLGAKRKRTVYDDPSFLEYRTLQPIGGEKRQVTSKYGTSILLNAIPTYKRLRLAEDSLLLARTTRGIMKYIYKIKVDSTNLEGVAEIVDNYTSLLKHARAIDNSSGSPHFDNKANPMASVEDIIIPVWGDSANDLVIDKIGGEVDIKWIKDIEELRNELSAALRVPLSLLGAHVEETSGALGGSSLEKLDIRFARSSRRLQRALIEGITRLCQIHLAYQNLDPDTRLFQVHMGETSTAEEESLQESLGKGVDTISTLFDVIEKASPNFDKVKLLDYFNKKFLKLNDLDFSKYIKNMPVEQEHTVPAEGEDQDVGNDLDLGAELGAGEKLIDKLPNEAKEAIIEAIQEKKEMHEVLRNSDFRAATPSPDGMVLWESRYKTCKVKVEKRN